MLNADVVAFLAVVNTGSFTQAAEHLQTSKARVSQQVSQLEKQLGITLLHRSTRRLRLTEVGDSFYSECTRAARILQHAKQQISEQQNDIAGSIKLNSVGGLFAEQLLTPAIIEFMQLYPEINIHLDFTSAQVDVMAENFDLVIRMGQLNDSSLIARKLMEVKTDVVASPNYLTQHPPLNTPSQLEHLSCLCGSVRKWSFVDNTTAKTQDVVVSGALTSANGHVLCSAALSGLGIVRLNRLYTQPYLSTGQLVAVLNNWHVPTHPVSLIYPKVRYKTKRLQVFIDFLVEWFETHSPQ